MIEETVEHCLRYDLDRGFILLEIQELMGNIQ